VSELGARAYETTSGAAFPLASIDAGSRQMVEDGEELIGEALRLARKLAPAHGSSDSRRSSPKRFSVDRRLGRSTSFT
jgi:hypothetical protein